MVKEAEVESLKKYVKELRETIENEDMSKELQTMKRSYSMTKKEKEMKDIMIE
jgi:hypothetical protein